MAPGESSVRRTWRDSASIGIPAQAWYLPQSYVATSRQASGPPTSIFTSPLLFVS